MKRETLNFFESVYNVVNLIPFGRVTSYGAIANYLGAKRSARLVGINRSIGFIKPYLISGGLYFQSVLSSVYNTKW